ncbi:hypothetical protein [Bradyrhizobium sp.]|uniref:hypothetical protein n=1 Tax=Bradyrhizobium sp. TaxID=376 RepID=UPI0039E3EE53
MPEALFDVGPIARNLNARAASYAIGELQDIRMRLRGYSRRPSSDIFTSHTIHQHWAFHYGGRTELQFNIGVDGEADDELRHGVAFSFQLSQSLPSIDALIPKVRLFNEFMRLYPEEFGDMRMWHYADGERSDDYAAGPILTDLVRAGPFVFLGRRQLIPLIDYDEILSDFDRLLPLYQYVESGGREEGGSQAGGGSFVFRAGCVERPGATTATLAERELNVSLRHNVLQTALTRRLVAQYGVANVATEHSSGLGTKIDVVLRRTSKEYWYY